MSEPTFDKQTVYHSYLRDASPVVVKFKKHVQKSKYKDRLPWVPFNVKGDPTDYTYQVENDRIADILNRVPLNVWVKATFIAGEDNGDVALEYEEGGEVELGAEAKPARSNGKPQRRPRRAQPTSDGYPTYADDLWYAILASRHIHERYVAEFGEELTESVRSLGVAIHIQASRESYAKSLMEELPTPEDVAAGPVPTETEIVELAENAPITAQQRNSLIESLADGTMDDGRKRTMVAWLRQKIADAEAEDAPIDLFEP